MIFFTQIDSPLGMITLSSDGECLTGLHLENQRYFPNMESWKQAEDMPVLLQTKQWLEAYFSGSCPEPDLIPLDPQGTAFQKRVWQQLLTIPYGTTSSYGALAKAIGCGSAQAVGNAVGRNPISILIPCHRVVGADGSLTGYAGGLEKKQWLLALEQKKQ